MRAPALHDSMIRKLGSGTLSLGLVTCLLACQQDYRFDTHARYEAPGGMFQVSVHATGLVPAGADLSERATADVRLTPLPSAGAPAVHLTIARPGGFSYHGTAAEFAELQRAIDGALFAFS